MWGMRQMVVVDHALRRSWLLSVVDPEQPEIQAARDARARLEESWHLLDVVEVADDWMAGRCARRTALSIEPTLSQRQFEARSEEHTSELQSQFHLVCRLLLEKKT